ncbi:hypothetical protein RhiirA5_397681 [Rhizophagus irregularis]|uniref:ribonuclease H n=1 Tax=Rhizophagus irregularis TaxID=588596 RepID=A0A2N0PWG6_9GLOM|nr:hypothetical protein RhiirA5_397681 [Rhizophagus irregularis]
MPFKTIKNLFSWSKQKLLSLRTTNRETETTRKVETEEGDFEQRPNTPQKQNIQDRNTTRTQQTENNYTQQNANVYNNSTYNLTFMGHNINGLGPDHSKLNLLIEYCSNKGADIIGICETNRDRKHRKFWNKQTLEYTSFWTNKDNKIKGSGVCIMINKKWGKHIGKVNRIGAYYIEAWLLFKNCTLIVGVIYIPPSDTKIQSELTSYIKKEFTNHSKKNRYYILIGDLNSYLDRTLDYSGPSKLGKKPSNIITWLDNAFFTDTYRKLNPKKRCFTWKNKNTSTRIDYIWADPKLEANIRKSHIYQSIDITDSDHNITLAEISFTNIIVTNNKGGRRAEKSSTRIVYDYENTTNEQWNRYEKYLNGLLKKHKAFRYIENHGQNEDTLNKLWDIICNCIQQAALKHIPHKKIGGVKTNFNRNYKEIENSSKERKDLLYIRSIMRKLYKNELKGVELCNASKGIKSFNQCYRTNIAEITEDTDWHTWKCETRNWLKIPDVTVLNKIPNNHAYNVMRKAHDYLFKFQPLTDNEEWDIPLIGPNVRNFVYQQASKMHRKDKEFIIRKAASMSIYGALQLVNQDASDTVTWQQICDINKRPARGRTPQWFNSLTDIIQKAPNLKNYYMTDKAPFDSENRLENDGMYLKNAQAFRMPKKLPSTDNRKKEFVHMQQDYTLTFGQIKQKLQTGKHTIQHWTTADSEQRMDNEVPYKLIKRCGGCSLNDRRVNKENRGCFFNKDRTSLTCINRVSKYRTDPDTRIIKDIIETRGYPQLQQNVEHSPSYIQMVDYDTALIQNTLVNNEAMTQHIALLQQIRSTFNPSDMINIYTDGSLTNRFNNSSNTFTKYMGTGWVILNSKDEVILECSSSITDWPSSTRAELGAILSTILVLQTGQKANILTDSQAAIDSINYIRTNLTNGKNKTRIWCKCNNYSIVSCIINLIDSKRLEIKLVKVKGHSGAKGNEEADRVAKNDTNSLTCIKIKDSQQKDLIYDIYWDGIRVDRHIRKFIDNLCESTLDAAWSLNRTHRSVFSDTTDTIEEEVTWTLFKKNTGSNCTTSMINDRFIKHLKLLNYLLPTLEIMKERRYDLYGDVKCRFCLEENEDDDHMIYCKQLSDKWITIANNTVCKCNQTIKNFLLQEKNIQLSQEDIQQLLIWNRNFFAHTIDANLDLPIPHIHLMIRSFFPKEKYRELKIIVKTKRIALTIAALFLEVFVNEFYNIIWQPRCKVTAEWEHTKGIKKQDLRKKPLAHQRIVYKRILTLQTEDGIYDLEKRKILKHNEQWSIALEKARQYINQFIKEGNRRVVEAYTEIL